MKITKEILNNIEFQLFNKARDIDVALYNALFLNMKDFLVDALSMYQNKDGGFGRNLEIDNYNPNSLPAVTLEALRMLKMAGFDNLTNNDFLKEILKKTFNYLYNKSLQENKLWAFSIKSNNDYPCAIWWKYDERIKENYNPTAGLIAHSIHFNEVNSPYYKKALGMVKNAINYYINTEISDKHEINCFQELLEVLINKNIEVENLDIFKTKLFDDSLCIVAKDKKEFLEIYPNMPLDLFNEYTSNEFINKLINDNLDYIIESRKPHGLWDINFKWQNDHPEQETAYIKWIGHLSVINLYLLKKFERIEE